MVHKYKYWRCWGNREVVANEPLLHSLGLRSTGCNDTRGKNKGTARCRQDAWRSRQRHICCCSSRRLFGSVVSSCLPRTPRSQTQTHTHTHASWNLSLTYLGASCRQLDFRIILERARWLILGSGLKSCLKYKKVSGCLEALARPLAVFLFVYYILYLDNCFFYVYTYSILISWYVRIVNE